jgi:RNA-directed DNA polymerase
MRDLEHRLGVKREELREILRSRSNLYRPFETPKKRHPYPGKKRLEKAAAKPPKLRQIDNPVKQLKDIQTRILRRVLFKVLLPEYMFGAVAGRTLTMHAKQHVPNQNTVVVRMDISSYYPNITCTHVYFVWNFFLGCPPPIASLLTELTTFNYHLPQGAPTSPILANLLLASIYAPVCHASEIARLTITTWVDDLIFSGPSARTVMNTVRSVLASNGLRVAPEKREILGPHDEKVITGARLGL